MAYQNCENELVLIYWAMKAFVSGQTISIKGCIILIGSSIQPNEKT